MPARKRIILALTAISLLTTIFSSAIAENPTDVESLAEENVALTGESLQGIQPKNITEDSNNRATSITGVTIEREEPQNNSLKTGNEFIDSLMTPSNKPNEPLAEGLDKNNGDRSTMRGGKIPIANF